MKKLVFNKGKAIMALAVGAALSAGVVATTATFSQQSTNTVEMTSGTIDLSATHNGTTTIDLGSNLYPGMPAITKTIIVSNTKGSLPLEYNMNTTEGVGGLGAVLDVDVKVGSASVSTKTKLKDLKVANRTISPKSSETLTVTFSWPSGTTVADNALQGKTDNATFNFSGAVKSGSSSN